MRRRAAAGRLRACAARLLLAGLCLAVAGCESVRTVPIDAARFAPAQPDAAGPRARLPGRVALVMPPLVLQSELAPGQFRAAQPNRLRWPVGRLVEAALLGALEQRFADGALRVDTPPGAGFAATVRVTEVGLEGEQVLRHLIPVPIPGVLFIADYEYSVQLRFEMQLIDPQGRPLWTRRYDTGRTVLPRLAPTREPAIDALVRLAHDAAWQLAQQAAQDLHAWVDAERTTPRRL